jgi:hypothetical protein
METNWFNAALFLLWHGALSGVAGALLLDTVGTGNWLKVPQGALSVFVTHLAGNRY